MIVKKTHRLSTIVFGLVLLFSAYNTQSAAGPSNAGGNNAETESASIDLTSHLMAWWPFEGNCTDESGNGNNGVVHGATLTEDRFGNPESAYQFDGVNDYIDIGNRVKPPLPITVTAWVKLDSLSASWQDCVFRSDLDQTGSNDYRYGVDLLVSRSIADPQKGHVSTHIYEGYALSSTRRGKGSTDPVVTTGTWHHLTTVIVSKDDMRLYWNGAEIDGTYAGTGTRLLYSSSGHGALGVRSGVYWHGAMDDVRVYARVLSNEEILALYEDDSGKEMHIRPDKGGDTGRVSVTITGRQFQEGATVMLSRNGEPNIIADIATTKENGRIINTTFDLAGASHGTWDVTIINPDNTSYTIPDGFTVEECRPAEPWVDIVGFNTIRTGRPQSYYIFYGNRGNVDAGVVPIWIAGIPTEVLITPHFKLMPLSSGNEDESTGVDEVPLYLEVDGEIVIPLIIPVIPPIDSGVLEIAITVPQGVGPFTIRAWANSPFFSGSLINHQDLITCLSALIELLAPPEIGCPAALGQAIHNLFLDIFIYENPREVGSYIRELLEILTACSGTPNNKHIELAKDIIEAILNGVGVGEACSKLISTESGSEKPVTPIESRDPNGKVGSQGAGIDRYLSGEEPLRYSILFENLSTATAPAQEVIITDQLDPNKVDLSTLNIGSISFGNRQIVPAWGLNNFATDVDLRPDKNIIVHITGRLNPNSGMLTWHLSALDPVTGDFPADPMAGFLPPNINPPEGDGSVLFTVMPKEDLPTGTEIRNSATIFFDLNPPIDTNDWVNTIDNTTPESEVLSLEPVQTSPEFEVQWTGTDEGVGIKDYTIYVSQDDGPFTPWITDTNDTSGLFSGEPGKTYMFYSIARDQTGNREDIPLIPDTFTQIEANRFLTISVIGQGSITEPGIGSFEYSYGQEVSVTAVADPNFKFCRWEGTAADSNAVIVYQNDTGSKIWVTIDSDNILTAVFDEVIHNIPLDSDPGWPMNGEWEFGIPTGQNCNSIGNPDPNSGHTGPYVIGVNLDGCYNLDTGPLYDVVAGPFNLSGHRNVKVRFWRWLNTDFPEYIENRIEMSLDGNIWSPVWIQPAHKEITDSRWTLCEYPISGADCQPAVYLRWTYQIRRKGIYAYTGWNIDDIQLTGCQDECQ